MPDPYEVDDEGHPVAEEDAASEAPAAESEPADADLAAADPIVGDAAADGSAADDPEAQAALRRQVEQTLRFMQLQTAVGFVVLLVLIVVLSSIRGVMVLVTVVFLFTSMAAYAFLRRTLTKRVLGR